MVSPGEKSTASKLNRNAFPDEGTSKDILFLKQINEKESQIHAESCV
jgi:hypothetical protein